MTKVRHTGFARLTQKDVSAVAARHEMLYSGRIGGARAVFAFCDLSGLDLAGRNLADADFTGCILEEANLQGAKLDAASFFGADLRRANLEGASLRRGDLRGASMRGANLIGADLFEADLREGTIAEKDKYGTLRVLQHDLGPSELPAAMMNSANLERAKMAGAIAVQADFTDAVMKGCRLTRANLRQARLTGANLENADLSGCNLTGADLAGCILIGAKMDFATTHGADMTKTLTEANLPDAAAVASIEKLLEEHSQWAETDARLGKPADLTGKDLRQITPLSRYRLTALIAPEALFYGINLEGASLQGSNLAGCGLRSAKLGGADLRGVNLSGALLNHADLRDCKRGPLMITSGRWLRARLDKAKARYADMRGTDLRRSRLSGCDMS